MLEHDNGHENYERIDTEMTQLRVGRRQQTRGRNKNPQLGFPQRRTCRFALRNDQQGYKSNFMTLVQFHEIGTLNPHRGRVQKPLKESAGTWGKLWLLAHILMQEQNACISNRCSIRNKKRGFARRSYIHTQQQSSSSKFWDNDLAELLSDHTTMPWVSPSRSGIRQSFESMTEQNDEATSPPESRPA